MKTITMKYKGGGSRVLWNVMFSCTEGGLTAHYEADTDRAIYTVYLLDEDGFFVREYNKFNTPPKEERIYP